MSSLQTIRFRRHGFTLIELILSLAACAVLLAAIYGVFSKAINLRNEATERTRLARLRARAETVIRNDLRNARISGGTLAATLSGGRDGTRSSFPGYLKFTTTTAVDNGDDLELNGELQVVEYYITTDPEAADVKAGVLVRAVDQALLATTRTEPPAATLLRGVDAMEVSFYDGTTWQESWEVTEDEKTLPKAVRVILRPAIVADRVQPPLEILVPWSTQPAIPAPAAATDAAPTPP
ncbi:MAG: type II secretion system protein GspJ [Verrucomicrobiota bacterium]